MNIVAAFKRAMKRAADQADREDSSVPLEEIAAHLAEEIRRDDALRAEVAALLVAYHGEPFGSVAREMFREATDEPLEEFIRKVEPSLGRLRELEEEWYKTPVPASYRQAMRGGQED